MAENQNKPNREYDVALSFAGEDREYVEAVASSLQQAGVSVFYDRHEEAVLWGKNLYDHLRHIYAEAAQYTVMFVSAAYARKVWTNHERESAQSRAFEERREYILPARFDDSDVPGLLKTIGYIDLRKKKPEELASLILRKLRPDDNATNSTPQICFSNKGDVEGTDEALESNIYDIMLNMDKGIDPAFSTNLTSDYEEAFKNLEAKGDLSLEQKGLRNHFFDFVQMEKRCERKICYVFKVGSSLTHVGKASSSLPAIR
jgi:hypothetical protein